MQKLLPSRHPFLFFRRTKSRLSRVTEPFRNAAYDYFQVAKDTGEYMKTHPFKTSLMCVAGVAMTMMWKKNPDTHTYTDEVLWYSNEISQCSQQTRNQDAHTYISDIVNMKCTGRLQHVDLGFFSVVVERPFSEGCHTYSETCTYLQPRWSDYWNRVVDVGFWNRWWILKQQMADFDVNEDDLIEYR